MLSNAQQIAIDQFLQSGSYDVLYPSFDGRDHFDRIRRGHRSLAEAIVSELRIRESKIAKENASIAIPQDLRSFTRAKVAPMVRGLFKKDERELVLSLLEVSVEFVTAERVEVLILQEDLGDARQIANLYLRSIGAEPISSESPNIVGFSTEAKCFVSSAYFIEAHPLNDYVIHELAHIFHNVKRRTAGLRKSLQCEWLLPVPRGLR